MTEHTPLPWKYEKSTKTIRATPSNYWLATMDSFDGAVDHEANAEFIVRACNSHDDLIEACKTASRALESGSNQYDRLQAQYVLIEALNKATNPA